MDVGFIGLGSMGQAMAGRLLDANSALTVWNRSKGPLGALADRGATIAPELLDVFTARVVLSMLSNDTAVLDTFTEAFLSTVPPGRVHVNLATVSLDAARELQRRHRAHGVGYVSAPVLGRPPVASAGTLLIVAAGDPDDIAEARGCLELLSAGIYVVGTDAAAASLVKIAVNYNIIHALQALAESVSLVERGGVDPSVFVELLTHTAFAGSAYRGYGPMIAEARYEPVGFAMELGVKDLGLAETAAAAVGASLPTASVLRGLFVSALADPRLSQLDWSAVAEVTRHAGTPTE